MKDDTLMKTPVSAMDSSRFASASLVPDAIASHSAPTARALLSRFATASLPEESLVVDDRSHLTPAQMVENKLMTRLKESSMPVSHLQMMGLVKKRYEA